VRSIREHWLATRQARLQAGPLNARFGHPTRDDLLVSEDLTRAAEVAEEQLKDALDELVSLSVFSVDPARGFAQIPFLAGKELAWFIFDLFEPQGIVAWRFESDPSETRRPLAEDPNHVDLPPLRAAAVDALMSVGAESRDDGPATPGYTPR
jgi:hypothetical protein